MKKRLRSKQKSKKTALTLLIVATFSIVLIAVIVCVAASRREMSEAAPQIATLSDPPPAASPPARFGPTITWPRAEIRIDDLRMSVEIADTPQRRATGLSGRRSLPAEQGMLFVFAYPERAGFWMKDTAIPLSIAFISSEGVIVQIEHLTPFDLRTVMPHTPIRYALEVNRGFFEDHGITPGSRVDLAEAHAVLNRQ